MRQGAAAWAALTLAWAGAAAAQEAAPAPLVTEPVWTSRPSLSDFHEAYPKRALRGDKPPAQVVLACRFDGEGLLGDCQVMGEVPVGKGMGRAAMKLVPRFRAAPNDAQGAPVAGRVVEIPVLFQVQGKTTPPTSHQPGRPSVLVTEGLDGPGEDLACPSKDDPKRMCKSHGFAWEEAPSVRTDADMLKEARRREGISFMECSRADDGALTACAITGDTPERSRKVMEALAGQFRAPAQAADGTPLSAGRILTTWDWSAISKAIGVAEDLPPTP